MYNYSSKITSIMSKKTLWLGAVAALALTTACQSNDDYSTWGDAKEVTFNAAIKGEPTVRVTGTTWDANDAIGVYMSPAGQGLASATATNAKFVTTGGGAFTAAGTTLYYPTDGSATDFVAYYPYSASTSGNIALSVANQAQPTAIDLLYAKATNTTGSGATNLVFAHQLAKATYTVSASPSVSLAGLKVVLKGATTDATFDLATGALTPGNTKGDITLNVSADGTKAEAIVLPTTLPAGATLEFTLADGTTKVVDVAGKAFTAGTITATPVSFTKAGETVQVAVGFNATITDWNTTPGTSINIDLDDNGTVLPPPPPPSGSNPAPGTVLFTEEFGASVAKVNNFWPGVDTYTGWTNTGFTFSDPLKSGSFSSATVRSTSTLNPHVYLAANKDAALLISGFTASGTGTYKLTYSVAVQTANTNQNVIAVYAGATQLTVPSHVLTTANQYSEVAITGIPAAQLTNLKFEGTAAANKSGVRIDNVKLMAE